MTAPRGTAGVRLPRRRDAGLATAGEPGSTRQFLLILGAALAICAFLKVPSLYYDRTEMDERIYWTLAGQLAQHGSYTLQGTDLLGVLSPAVYDHPLFHHPPLFAALLVPFVLLDAQDAAVTVSWLGHLLAVLAVGLVGRHILTRRPGATFTSPMFWLPLLGIAADPLFVFVSRKLWIDSILSGLVALSFALLFMAEGRRRLLLAAGTALGLAALAKMTALLMLPIYLLVVWRQGSTWRSRAGLLAPLIGPVVLFVVPWLVVYHMRTGVFIAPWVKPDAWLVEHYPMLSVVLHRPWYYYAVKLPLLMPLTLVCAWRLVRRRDVWSDDAVLLVCGWFVLFVLGLTALSSTGYGFQMRHIAPSVTAIYILAMLLATDRPAFLAACAFAIWIGTVTGALFLLNPVYDELLSMAEIAHLVVF